MTKDEIVRSLKICSENTTCEGCCFKDEKTFCKGKLMGIAAKCIDSLAKDTQRTINKLKLDKETLEEMLAEKYTKAQLVQSVNDILEDTIIEDFCSTIQSVLAFLRLIDVDGYFAILPDGTAEIRLNE